MTFLGSFVSWLPTTCWFRLCLPANGDPAHNPAILCPKLLSCIRAGALLQTQSAAPLNVRGAVEGAQLPSRLSHLDFDPRRSEPARRAAELEPQLQSWRQ